MPKLVCLMCLYNKENDVPKAIESVLMQKTKFEYKLLIIDDCSTDNSLQIAKDYEQKYPNIVSVVHNEKNLGLLKTVLKGYSLLEDADYYCVLDPDDWYTYEFKFEEAVSFLETHRDYSCYATNITLHKKSGDTLWIGTKAQEIDQTYETGKTGRGIFIQTSGSVFRNTFSSPEISAKIKNIMSLPFPEHFRADSFRQNLALTTGKMHFKNQTESVYNYNEEEEYSCQSAAEQDFDAAVLFYSFAHFFEDDKDYYMNEFYERLRRNAVQYGKELFDKKKDTLIKLLGYMNDRPDELLSLLYPVRRLEEQHNVAKKTKLKYRLLLKFYKVLYKKLYKKGYINDKIS